MVSHHLLLIINVVSFHMNDILTGHCHAMTSVDLNQDDRLRDLVTLSNQWGLLTAHASGNIVLWNKTDLTPNSFIRLNNTSIRLEFELK